MQFIIIILFSLFLIGCDEEVDNQNLNSFGKFEKIFLKRFPSYKVKKVSRSNILVIDHDENQFYFGRKGWVGNDLRKINYRQLDFSAWLKKENQKIKDDKAAESLALIASCLQQSLWYADEVWCYRGQKLNSKTWKVEVFRKNQKTDKGPAPFNYYFKLDGYSRIVEIGRSIKTYSIDSN